MKYVVALNMRRPVRFDHVAALLVGTLAILGAVLISLQMTHDHASSQANSEGTRLATDIATRIAVTDQFVGWVLGAQQQGASLAVNGTARSLAGLSGNAPDDVLVGEANTSAAQRLMSEVQAMGLTGADGLDPYAKGMLAGSVEALRAYFADPNNFQALVDPPEIEAEVAQQNAQLALADAESSRSHIAVLGLTFTALGGVLAGLAVALKETRPGWAILILGWGVASLAIVTAVLSAI
jgi:hypothetical protein